MRTVYIHGGTVVDPSQGIECRADIVCVDGKVSEIFVAPSGELPTEWIKKADLISLKSQTLAQDYFLQYSLLSLFNLGLHD